MAAAAPILLVVGCGNDDEASTTTEDSGPVTTLEAPPTTRASVDSTAPPTTERPTTGAPTTTTTTTTTTTAPPTTPPPPVEFLPPEGDYAVTFPGQPRASNQEAALADGTTLPYVIYNYQLEVQGDARELGVFAVPFPPPSVINLDAFRDNLVKGVPGAHLISSEPIELQGRPGLQFSVDLAPGGTPSYYMSRVYTDGTKLYQTFYVGGTISPSDPHVLAFFDSFRFPEGG